MTRDLNELNENQKKFRRDFETVIFFEQSVQSPGKRNLTLSVTESEYDESLSTNSDFKEALSADACKDFEVKVDASGLLQEIEYAFVESFHELSLTDKKEIIDLLAKNYNLNVNERYGLKGFDISSIITKGNKGDIFALLAAMSKQNKNTDYYRLIPEERLRKQALDFKKSLERLGVYRYVVLAIAIPAVEGFGIVGFAFTAGCLQKGQLALGALKTGFDNALKILDAIHPCLKFVILGVAAVVGIGSGLGFCVVAYKNSKTNETNKGNIDKVNEVKSELDRNQKNIK